MPFRHGKAAEILLGGVGYAQDVSPFLFSVQWNAYAPAAEVSTFKSTWRSYIAGTLFSQFFGYGYYDPTLTNVRTTLQAAPGVLSYAPAGALVIGDFVRQLSFNTVEYKEAPKTTSAVPFQWSVDSTAPVGVGVSLHPLASENVGTITGTGDGILTSASSTTGGIGHLHVTAYTSGTHSFKFQDATTIGGAYTDIASGAFTNVTAVGAQRLIVPGTIRQFVRCVAVIGTAAATYSVSFART